MKKKAMTLFFTRGVSLSEWYKKGIFDREKIIYEQMLINKVFDKIYWITYGYNDFKLSEDLKKKNKLHKDIIILKKNINNNNKYINLFYSFYLIHLYKSEIKESSVLKTNQADGSWSAVISKILFNKSLYIRFGYMLSKSEILWKRKNFIKIKIMKIIEKFAINFSDVVSVTSENDKIYIFDQLNCKKEIRVNKSFVDTKKFNDIGSKKINRILYVGRYSKEKNLENIIKATYRSKIGIDIVGIEPSPVIIKKLLISSDMDVKFLGHYNNDEMPKIYNKYKYYLIGSLSEGLPKTLIEAMACKMLCIGTNVVGINNIIKNNVNGFLSQNCDFMNIAKAIKKTINYKNSNLIRENARALIVKEFSFTNFYANEVELIKKII